MANNTKAQPQVVAPATQEGPLKRLVKDFKKSYQTGPVRKFVDENLLKTRQHRGGVR